MNKTMVLMLIGAGLSASTVASAADNPAVNSYYDSVLYDDAYIENLVQRVDRLETIIGALAQATKTQQKPRPAPSANPATTRSTATRPAPASNTASAKSAPGASSPGTFEVDSEAAERALERTLTQDGVLLLPPKKFEFEPFLTYTRQTDDQATLILTEDDKLGIKHFEIRRNIIDTGIRVRVGLALDSQLELELPYRIAEESVVFPIGTTTFEERSQTGNALGDVKIGLAKTLMHEDGWWPDLVGRLTWDTDTGERFDNGVNLGNGFNEVRVSLSALKRQDPLAFTTSVYYQKAFETDNLQPGDKFGLALGVSLAASPETSLSATLQQSYVDEYRIDNRKVPGSDQVISSFVLTASSILGRGMMISLSAGVGLTDSATDYFIGLTLPIRY